MIEGAQASMRNIALHPLIVKSGPRGGFRVSTCYRPGGQRTAAGLMSVR